MNRTDFSPYRRTTVGFDRLFDLLESQVRNNAGDNYPPFNIERRDEDSYRITLGGAAIGGGKIKPNHLLAIDTGEAMNSQPIPGEATVDPSFGCPALWIDPGTRDLAVAEGYLAVDPESVIATHIHQLLATRAHDLLGPDQVRDLIDHLRGRHGQLIETITPQPLTLAAVTRLLKALLADGISLRHSLRVFSSLSLAAQQTAEHDRLIDIVRADLGAMIVSETCPPDAKLPVITLAGLQAGQIFGGAILTETVFAWPGIGRLMFEAINQRDYNVILGVFYISAAMVLLFNLITDVIYVIVDPRIRLTT